MIFLWHRKETDTQFLSMSWLGYPSPPHRKTTPSRLGIMGAQLRAPWNPSVHDNTIVLRGIRGSSIGAPLRRETKVSQTANVFLRCGPYPMSGLYTQPAPSPLPPPSSSPHPTKIVWSIRKNVITKQIWLYLTRLRSSYIFLILYISIYASLLNVFHHFHCLIACFDSISYFAHKAQRHVESILICFSSSTCDWLKVITSLLLANHKCCLKNKWRSTLHVVVPYSSYTI